MKNFILSLVLFFSATSFFAQEDKSTMMITGASFAVTENGWFELACDAFRATAINKSISGSSIKDAAKSMFNGTLYSKSELEATDVFVIMHVHNQGVANSPNLKEDYTEYTLTEISSDYAVAYDYVIKKYQADCYNQKDVPTSKYYGTENGKPATIILCTHWHDSRTKYNTDIRILAEKWKLPLVKWDDNIGFTKDILDENGKQPSLKYAGDTENISGIIYGWHPLRGKNQYIQQKIAEIFIIEMQNILGEIPVGVTMQAKSNVIREGEDAFVKFAFTGLSPWNLTYKIGEEQFEIKGIMQNPLAVKIEVPSGTNIEVAPLSVSNPTAVSGSVSNPIIIGYRKDVLNPISDTFVHQANPDKTYYSETALDLKLSNKDPYSRETFLTFNIEDLDEADKNIALRLYYDDLIYPTAFAPEDHLVQIAGIAQTYSNLKWSNRPSNLEMITESWILASEKKSYIGWDVSDWILKQKEAGKTEVTFRLSVVSGGVGLFKFPSMEAPANKPELLTAKNITTGITEDEISNKLQVYPNPFNNLINVNSGTKGKVSICTIDGNVVYKSAIEEGENEINTANLQSGIYFLNCEIGNKSVTNKIIKTQ